MLQIQDSEGGGWWLEGPDEIHDYLSDMLVQKFSQGISVWGPQHCWLHVTRCDEQCFLQLNRHHYEAWSLQQTWMIINRPIQICHDVSTRMNQSVAEHTFYYTGLKESTNMAAWSSTANRLFKTDITYGAIQACNWSGSPMICIRCRNSSPAPNCYDGTNHTESHVIK